MAYKNGRRIKQARLDAGLSIKELAQSMGVSYNTITNWESNYARPNVDYTRMLCGCLGVSADYLLGVEDVEVKNDGLDSDERWLVNSYRSFGTSGRKFIRSAALCEIERGEALRSCDAEQSPFTRKSPARRHAGIVTLREFLQAASAGFGDYLTDDDSYEQVNLYSTDITRRADMIIRVNGDSMQPEYLNGDRLLVMECDDISKGKTGVFLVNGDGFVKVFGGDRLISLNKRYKDIVFNENDDVRCVGLVIGKVDESMTPNRDE